ncbi:MAG: hypothetical protein AUG12_04890 [Acidobacteria bacterium 13_1_20CM_2_57_8]|nr:MAG: hypothetical protein AUI54_03700 [Acidobacteria bacterium 13_1_40CM_2_56_5]OLE73569.1 MAG: hypothetical protein AUG12_04890 [Acidobacteria bacterium 13_1_20CM_2_57_8]
MKRFGYIFGIFFAFAASASAQPATSRWNGYLFFAPGASEIGSTAGRATIHIGGGGEAFIYHGLSLGAEVGPIISWSPPGSGFRSDVHGLGSANIAYHFLPKTTERKLEPFLTAGYSLFFSGLSVPGRGLTGTQSGYNVGGGVNLWFQRKYAIRLEVRHQSSIWYKTMDIRLGMTFK